MVKNRCALISSLFFTYNTPFPTISQEIKALDKYTKLYSTENEGKNSEIGRKERKRSAQVKTRVTSAKVEEDPREGGGGSDKTQETPIFKALQVK